jgi:hypothetical protein
MGQSSASAWQNVSSLVITTQQAVIHESFYLTTSIQLLACPFLESSNPRIATECGTDGVYMLVQDNSVDDGRISVLRHDGESWSYVGNSRFVEYANSASPVRVQRNADWQWHDIQVRGDEVCVVFLENEFWPFVYCYRDDRWVELGGPSDSKRIGKHSEGGDLELLMPGCDCPELHDVYFVIGSRGQSDSFAYVEAAGAQQSDWKNHAVVWYYIDNDELNPEKKWKPMGGGTNPDNYLVNNIKGNGQYHDSSDGHLAISGIGQWGCHLHAVVSDDSSKHRSDESTDKHLRFSRFSTSDKAKFDAGSWKVLASIRPSEACYENDDCNTAMLDRNDFTFANGVPAVAWVDSVKEFAYLSVWRDYTSVDETYTDQSGPTFTIAGYNQRMGSVPPMNEGRWSSKSPMYENPLAVTIDSHGPMVYLEITSAGSGKDWNGIGYGKKIYVSAIDATDPGAEWIEYSQQSNGWGAGKSNGHALLPHPKPHELGLCGGNKDKKTGSAPWQAGLGDGGASHLRTTCSGDIMVAHVGSKSNSPHGSAMLARNGPIDPNNQCSKRRLGSSGGFLGGFFGW